MQKILLALNAVKINPETVEFACDLAKLTNSSVTGLFLENLAEDKTLKVRNAYDGTYINLEVDEDSAEYRSKMAATQHNVDLFGQLCEKNGVRTNACLDGGRPISEVIRESNFADLLIVDADTTFRKMLADVPSSLVKRILQGTGCPVIVAPKIFQKTDDIIFLFDGQKSSMFSIKQFTYLFPQFASHKLIVLHVADGWSPDAAEPDLLKDWLQNHYSNIAFKILRGKSDDDLLEHLSAHKNAMIVMGAYGRSFISRQFRKSYLDPLVKTLDQAFFIAHY